ncbi:MAG: hypothetical protein ACOZQL_19090 [Myxococcota bacterium]
MPTNLATTFPNLERLASSQGTSLALLAARPGDETAFLNLASSCWWVASGLLRQEAVADPYGYLATLDAFLGSFTETELPRQKFWNKIKNPNASAFLDTVAEAAFSVQLRQGGQQVRIEQPFAAAQGSKDADILLTANGTDHWLDVICLDPHEDVIAGGFVQQGPTQLAELFSRAVERKYNKKFRDAVANGPLQGASVGVLACILKYEAALVPLVLFGHPLPEPPPALFQQCPGLSVAWVHTLRKPVANTDLLVPMPVLRWFRS